jgi:hypothetical protein
VTELIVNLSDAREKRNLLDAIRRLEGMQRVTICSHRKRRSDRQNRYYWPCFVQPFAEYLNAQGEAVTDDEAHTLLKQKFLRRSVADPETGEFVGDVLRSTTDLNTAEFNEYLENCAAWLADFFGINVPDPSIYREPTEATSGARRQVADGAAANI